MNDPLPEFTRGMVDGEARVRIGCTFCGTVEDFAVLVPEYLRDKLVELMQQDPDEMLEVARTMATVAAGWSHTELRDGGTVDICRDCLARGDWLKL